jgi:outer membrane immunogenic protein
MGTQCGRNLSIRHRSIQASARRAPRSGARELGRNDKEWIMRILALLALSAAAAATPAMAQSNAPGGFYLGALGGYEGIDVESADAAVSASADSAVYGINAGYDLSLGSAFVGIEGELSTSGSSTDFPDSFTGVRDGLEANGQYAIGARAGLALTPSIAAYGKVGYTALETRAFTSSGSLAELEDNAGGFRFGGGLQVQLPGPLEGRLEYRRSRYGDLNDEFGNVTTDQVVAGLGLRF